MKKGEHVAGELCNHCGKEDLVFTGNMTYRMPPQYVLSCRSCGHRKTMEMPGTCEPSNLRTCEPGLDWHRIAVLIDEIQVQLTDAWHNFARVKLMLADYGLGENNDGGK